MWHTKMHFPRNTILVAFHIKHYLDYQYVCVFARYATLVPRLDASSPEPSLLEKHILKVDEPNFNIVLILSYSDPSEILNIKAMLGALELPSLPLILMYTYNQIGKTYHHTIVYIFLPISFNMCFGCSRTVSWRRFF